MEAVGHDFRGQRAVGRQELIADILVLTFRERQCARRGTADSKRKAAFIGANPQENVSTPGRGHRPRLLLETRDARLPSFETERRAQPAALARPVASNLRCRKAGR